MKFWAVNAGPAVIDMPRKYVDQLARFLAKRGVNLVRMHGPLYIQNGPQAGQIDKPHLDNVFYFIAAMKREGIYSHLSIHFQHWLRINELPQFPGYTSDTLPFRHPLLQSRFPEDLPVVVECAAQHAQPAHRQHAGERAGHGIARAAQ